MSSIKEIDKRLSMLEAGGGSEKKEDALDFEAIKKKKNEQVMNKVEQVAADKMKLMKVDSSRFLDVVGFVVDFVEVLTDYVPDIVYVVGSAFAGEFKLATAIRLIYKLCTDIVSVVVDKNYIEDVVNHEVELKYHHSNGSTSVEGSKRVEKKTDHKKKSRVGSCFPFTSKRKQKGISDLD